jgi:hypothetical protein
MTNFYMQDGEILADGVDVKRLARNLRKVLSEITDIQTLNTDQLLDFASRLLSAEGYYQVRTQAKDSEYANASQSVIEAQVKKESVSKGESLPKGLPLRFSGRWREQATDLIDRAIASRLPGQLEFVALVGSEGSGKTIVAKDVCKRLGGLVLDVGFALDKGTGPNRALKSGQVLVYDQPAVLPRRSRPGTGDFGLWSPGSPVKPTIQAYREGRRYVHAGIPFDDPLYGSRKWFVENPGVTLIVSFGSVVQAQQAIANSPKPLATGDIQRSASMNWRRAHVVNLDTLSYDIIEGPGLLMEEGRYTA